MPTRATTKTTAKKSFKDAGTGAKAPVKTGRKSSDTISALPKIRAAAPKVEAPKIEPKPEPPKPKETVSLIDEPGEKVPRAKSVEAKAFKVLPPISRIMAAEQPAPAPAVAAVDVAQGEDAKGDSKIIHIKPPIIVRELALQLALKPFQVIGDLMEMNFFKSLNDTIEAEVASAICKKHGFVFEKEKRKEGGGVHKPVEAVKEPEKPKAPTTAELKLRPPIVAFMGHVDHGKTTLMDAIRKTRVAAGEAGGITQHIGAYTVERNGHKITFLDTPGHAAFTAMRMRGATVTDIVVLVIAADDGIMPQTIEAIGHAKAAKVKIVVAITKTDVPGANLDKVKGQLQEKGLQPEDWGGEIGVCPVSALKGQGVDELLERLLLEAEVLELKASESSAARGTVIEAQVEPGRGPTATVIIRMGTLHAGDAFICGNYSGKVKSLIDDKGKTIREAGPSMPVSVLGFSGLPNAGEEFVVMESERDAKILSEERLAAQRQEKLSTPQRVTLENLFATLKEGQRKNLRIVLKTDVQGSLEAIVTALGQIRSDKIELEILHALAGPITETDIQLASASDAIIVGFNTKVESNAAAAAKREAVQIKLYSIIYELIDQVKEAMAGLLDPEVRETAIGHAEVRKVFELSRGIVAGCMVTDGRIARTGRARVLRGRQPIYDGGLATLKRFTDDVKEVRNGLECGIKLGDFNDYEVGDIIECYQLEKFPQKL